VAVMERCGECGVPDIIGRELRWEDNGVISLTESPHNRMVIFESNIIDNTFDGLEEMLGRSIRPLVVESRRRETRRFIERSFPFEVRNTLLIGEPGSGGGDYFFGRTMSNAVQRMRRDISERVIKVATAFGYGKVALGWEEKEPYPWRTLVITQPYSLSLWMADFLGTVEAFEGVDMTVRGERVGKDVYHFRLSPGEHPVALRERLRRRRRYPFKPGDMEFERCPACGVPRLVSTYRWDFDKGTITASDTGRRVAFFGPLSIEAVLDDLEAEYGSSVPVMTIEAQKRYVKSRIKGEQAREVTQRLKELVALRGLGLLTELSIGEQRLEVHMQNACIHLFMVGLAQALFELAMGKENSLVSWDLQDDGDLHISVQVA